MTEFNDYASLARSAFVTDEVTHLSYETSYRFPSYLIRPLSVVPETLKFYTERLNRWNHRWEFPKGNTWGNLKTGKGNVSKSNNRRKNVNFLLRLLQLIFYLLFNMLWGFVPVIVGEVTRTCHQNMSQTVNWPYRTTWEWLKDIGHKMLELIFEVGLIGNSVRGWKKHRNFPYLPQLRNKWSTALTNRPAQDPRETKTTHWTR